MLSRQLKADLALLLVALIWGTTFVIVKDELGRIGPMALIALRFAFAFVAMVAVTRGSLLRMGRHQLFAGLVIGVFLFGGFALQTVGLAYTTASKAAFITGLCVVMAPLFARVLLGHRSSPQVLLGVALATLGLGLLSLTESLTLSTGDLLILGCAACFALHIVAISRFAPSMDAMALTTVQIGFVAVGGLVAMALLEPAPALPEPRTFAAAAFLGIVATAFAFAVQNRVQVFTTPTHTGLMFSLEPVFAAMFAYMLIGERLTEQQLIGCALMLTGMLAAELRRGGARNHEGAKTPGEDVARGPVLRSTGSPFPPEEGRGEGREGGTPAHPPARL
jgi:drug/metabolite transporter (DMT)-like permease